jgi:RNA polymerase sigma-70 factor (ECF subfamily)
VGDQADVSFDVDELARIYRRESGRCTATMIRVLGDVEAAEDAVAEAFAIAAQRWSVEGIPENPGGWITTTARNRAIDRHRRDAMRSERHRDAAYLDRGEVTTTPGLGEVDLGDPTIVEEDQLRLIFLCCHPSLAPDAQVALTLRLLGGLETAEIARAFLVPEATMAQRIVRAKRKIRDSASTYALPDDKEVGPRLSAVFSTVYLIFNEGHTASTGSELSRPDLIAEAIRLGRVLVQLVPSEPEAVGLLALMLLTETRRAARISPDGDLVRLADQDRTLWDHALIDEGHTLVRECVERDEPGSYQIQAAIAAVHAAASRPGDTEWWQIVALYDQLLTFQPNDVVRLNRAIAVAQVDGAQSGLDALASLDLDQYHLFHATRGEFLARLGRHGEALDAIDRAVEVATNEPERRFLILRRDELSEL